MAFYFECILLVVTSLVAAIYIYFVHINTYWKKRGIPYLPASLPFGNVNDALFRRLSSGVMHQEIYKGLDGNKYGGIFNCHRPAIMLRDPEIIKIFLAKDFAYFHDRGIYVDEVNDPIAAHLFSITGQKWKTLRAKLSPTFTSAKMKMMFQTLLDSGLELEDCLKERATKGETLEVKDIVARYSTDSIASFAFGVKCNSLRDPQAEFRLRGKQFFEPSMKFSTGMLLNTIAPSLASKVSWGRTPKHVSDFFLNMVKDTVEYREKNDVTRNDLMQLMIQLKNNGYCDKTGVEKPGEADNSFSKKMTVEEVAGLAFFYFLGGSETTSGTISFCLYDLALNPDIQTRVREEIDEILEKQGGEITYDAIQEMEYLDTVVAETLRKYPPIGSLIRECTAAYKLPDRDVVLEPGTQVVVSVLGLHHDPQYFPEPQMFDPKRFTQEAKSARHHYTYLPFGEGPRMCTGMRFGLMQTKIAIISLLRSYEFRTCEETVIPLVFDPKSFTLAPKGGIYLKIVNRTE